MLSSALTRDVPYSPVEPGLERGSLVAELGPASHILVAGFVWEMEWGKGWVSLGSVPSSLP